MPVAPGGMRRNDSSIWDWKATSPGSSENASGHGGGLFGRNSRNASGHGGNMFGGILSTSREASGHGGNAFGGMRRNVSFTDMAGGAITDDPSRQQPRSREASGHGGNIFRSGMSGLSSLASGLVAPVMPGGGLKRNDSWVWDWKGQTPPDSRNSSAHGGNAFAPTGAMDKTGAGEAPQQQQEEPPTDSVMRRSMSFLWDWGKYRSTPPGTPGNSAHGGNAFAPPADEDEAGQAEDEQRDPLEPAIQPPKSMMKSMSIGSFMWDWGMDRKSPPGTPGGSKHGGNAFGPDGTAVQTVPVTVKAGK